MPALRPPLRVVVVARLGDAKLVSKLEPLVAIDEIAELHVVRRTPLGLPGVRNHNPPPWLRGIAPLAEAWRLVTLLLLCLGRRRHTVVAGFFLVPHGAMVELARRLVGTAAIQVLLGEEDLVRALTSPFFSRAVRRAQAVGVRGPRSAERLVAHGVPRDRLFTPPNVFDPAPFAPDPRVVPDTDVVFVGTLVPCKRLDVLLTALARVRSAHDTLRAVFVGDGDQRSALESLATRLGLADRVTFAGDQPAEGVAHWLRRSRVFVLTSELEGLPMAMVEAMTCGLPVVVTDVGDVTMVARHEENAWVVPNPDPEAVARAILRLLQDGALRRRLAEGARRTAAAFAQASSLAAGRAEWRRALGLSSSS